eukprot:1493379-Rhodomonas_salina.2
MSQEEKGQNVKVVLRCRPMSASEQAKEKPAVRCVGDKSVEINYNNLGKVSKKAFAFDGVYDPSTSQKDIYDNVVRPVVDEVLQGYNCTVFAYGQTGTGKTYTMEGQFSDSKGKQEQPNAGIVPRAVAQVFKYLEEADLEYQVRISVVELYNEELSDLIAAGDDEGVGKLRKLRLLEDPKKGIVLQGVEERPVNTAGEIFHILVSYPVITVKAPELTSGFPSEISCTQAGRLCDAVFTDRESRSRAMHCVSTAQPIAAYDTLSRHTAAHPRIAPYRYRIAKA